MARGERVSDTTTIIIITLYAAVYMYNRHEYKKRRNIHRFFLFFIIIFTIVGLRDRANVVARVLNGQNVPKRIRETNETTSALF